MRHLLLLVAFCFFMVGIWMAPMLLAGFPVSFTAWVKVAMVSALSGTWEPTIAPLYIVFIRLLLPFIAWNNATAWVWVSAITLAVSLIPLWWSMRHLLGARIAWASVVVFAFLPMHWWEAVSTGTYPLSFLLLFLGCALFLHFSPHRRFLAVALLGVCFGLTLATTHAFFTFLPWFLGVYLWERRAQWRSALAELSVCGCCMYAGFALPLLPIALQPGLSGEQRIAVFLPIEENLMPPAELYGDAYAVTFLKQEIDQSLASQGESSSFFIRRKNENARINHGIGSFSLPHILFSNTWLFCNALASLFMQETVGGVFLWLFILPGLIALWHTHRRMMLQLVGLWLSMELILRYGFHYNRMHLIDTGWVIALFAGAGVVAVAEGARRSIGWLQTRTIIVLLLLLLSAQLAQESRTLFARWYSNSVFPQVRAAEQALQSVSADAVIAQPGSNDALFLLTLRTPVQLESTTLAILEEQGRLADPFLYYGVTHILGYDAAQSARIQAAVPAIQVIDLPTVTAVSLTPFKRYLLNLLR